MTDRPPAGPLRSARGPHRRRPRGRARAAERVSRPALPLDLLARQRGGAGRRREGGCRGREPREEGQEGHKPAHRVTHRAGTARQTSRPERIVPPVAVGGDRRATLAAQRRERVADEVVLVDARRLGTAEYVHPYEVAGDEAVGDERRTRHLDAYVGR